MVVTERMGATDKKLKTIKKRKRKSNEITVKAEVPNVAGENVTNDSKLTKENIVKENTESIMKKQKLTEGALQYPILQDEKLVQKLQSVPMNNNQKGRIRQILRDSLKGTSEILAPDVIHNRIQAILKNSEKHTDSDIRKMRILYNMLKTALKTNTTKADNIGDKNKPKKLKKKKRVKMAPELNADKEIDHNPAGGEAKKDEKDNVSKQKGPKRYVVFVGNLPLDIDKEKIVQHFSEIKHFIKDIRLPKQKEGKKSAIAYVEVENEMTYELALSKHHSMLGNKRINVLYTAQKKGKVSKTEAKSKSAKLVALQKSGKLVGSVPLNKKRSHRRMKMKQAQAKLAVVSA